MDIEALSQALKILAENNRSIRDSLKDSLKRLGVMRYASVTENMGKIIGAQDNILRTIEAVGVILHKITDRIEKLEGNVKN